jgi:regulator of replication initiation timing
MAKVVYSPGMQMDPRLMAELMSLRARVRELEQENTALRLENAAFDDEVRALAVETTVLA